MKATLVKSLLACALALSFCAVFLAMQGTRDTIFPADVGVVLGNEVYADGRPSPRLAARLDKAFQLYSRGLFPRIIVSGGTGKSGADEAAAMRDYLLARGVPQRDIVVDSGGVDTRRTAVFTAAYLKGNGLSSAIAVSQFYHMPRCRLAFRQAGIAQVGTAHADYLENGDFLSLLREVPAYLAYWAGARKGK